MCITESSAIFLVTKRCTPIYKLIYFTTSLLRMFKCVYRYRFVFSLTVMTLEDGGVREHDGVTDQSGRRPSTMERAGGGLCQEARRIARRKE